MLILTSYYLPFSPTPTPPMYTSHSYSDLCSFSLIILTYMCNVFYIYSIPQYVNTTCSAFMFTGIGLCLLVLAYVYWYWTAGWCVLVKFLC